MRTSAIVLVLAAGLAAAGPVERGPMPHLVDRYGDPLPAGAVARLGSVRLRHPGLKDFALLPDGKTAVTVGDDKMVREWDLGTGKQTRGTRLPSFEFWGTPALSPDGAAVAIPTKARMVLCDAVTGREVKTFDAGDTGAYQLFSPDGSTIAVGDYDVTLIDRRTGRVRRVHPADLPKERLPHRPFRRAAFSGDGRRLAVAGLDGPKGVVVIDVAEGREVFPTPTPGLAAVLSPDGGRLYVCTDKGGPLPDGLTVRVYDLATGREVGSFASGVTVTCFSLALSPDGKELVCGGRNGISRIDAATGRIRQHLAGQVTRLRFSPTGHRLAAIDGCELCVWDTATGRELNDRPGKFAYGYRAVSPDGRLLAMEDIGRGRVGLWDPADGQLIRYLPVPPVEDDFDLRFIFAPDGRRLLATCTQGFSWSWDVRTGRATRPTPVWLRDARGGPYHEYFPSPDGRRVAAMVRATGQGDSPRRLTVWDAATGRVIHRHQLALPDAVNVEGWLPDGSAVVIGEGSGTNGSVRVVDPEAGRVGPRFEAEGNSMVAADGRLAVVWNAEAKDDGGLAVVWEVGTGQAVTRVPTAKWGHRALGVAPAARAMVVADGRLLRVIDLATGKDRGRWNLPDLGYGSDADSPVWNVQVLPGDRYVLTPVQDGTALVWDLAAFPPPRLAAEHNDADRARWWAALAAPDARQAYIAAWSLGEGPADDVVRFLRERLAPARAPDPKEVARLIADLDGPAFRVREASARRLGELGPAVWPAVRQALKGSPSAEARERLEKLRDQLLDPVPPPETLRVLRAVAVLERVGTADARKVLEGLAGGADGAPETRAARSAVGRLAPKGW